MHCLGQYLFEACHLPPMALPTSYPLTAYALQDLTLPGHWSWNMRSRWALCAFFCILAFFCACRGILHGLAERGTSAATPVPLLQPLNLQPSLHPTTGTRPMLSPPCSMHVWQQLMPHKSVVDSAGPTNSALNLLELTLGWQCVCGFQGTFSHGIVCTRWACW